MTFVFDDDDAYEDEMSVYSGTIRMKYSAATRRNIKFAAILNVKDVWR